MEIGRNSHLEIYHTPNGAEVQLTMEEDTVWATQKQIGALFGTTPQNITLHLKNIYADLELEEKSTCKESLQVRQEGKRKVQRKQLVYNLDAILSVGYRINSRQGTQFRQWATKKIKDYLVEGFALNEKLLRTKSEQLENLKKLVQLQERVFSEYRLDTEEVKALAHIISDYSTALDLLDDFDHQRLEIPESQASEVFKITYSEARRAIKKLGEKTKFQGLFGREKDDSFKVPFPQFIKLSMERIYIPV